MNGGWGARIVAIAVAALVCSACGGEAGDEAPRRVARTAASPGKASGAGPTVATVDGRAIGADDVARVTSTTSLDAREALARLEEQELLAAEAEQRGEGGSPEVERAVERAMVQALLAREIEAAVPPESISDEALRAEHERRRGELSQPERRASIHLLARVPEAGTEAQWAAAEQFVRDVLIATAEASDASAVLEQKAADRPASLDVVLEQLPPVPRDGPFERAYLDALFEIPEPGPVLHPVRTRYGWHAIVVTEIAPATEVSFEDAREMLRRDVLAAARREKLDRWLADLERRHRVVRNEDAIERAMRQDVEGSPP